MLDFRLRPGERKLFLVGGGAGAFVGAYTAFTGEPPDAQIGRTTAMIAQIGGSTLGGLVLAGFALVIRRFMLRQ